MDFFLKHSDFCPTIIHSKMRRSSLTRQPTIPEEMSSLWKTLLSDILPFILNPLLRRKLSKDSISQQEYDDYVMKIPFTLKFIKNFLITMCPDDLVVHRHWSEGRNHFHEWTHIDIQQLSYGKNISSGLAYEHDGDNDRTTIINSHVRFVGGVFNELENRRKTDIDLKNWCTIQHLCGVSYSSIEREANIKIDGYENVPNKIYSYIQSSIDLNVFVKKGSDNGLFSDICGIVRGGAVSISDIDHNCSQLRSYISKEVS